MNKISHGESDPRPWPERLAGASKGYYIRHASSDSLPWSRETYSRGAEEPLLLVNRWL